MEREEVFHSNCVIEKAYKRLDSHQTEFMLEISYDREDDIRDIAHISFNEPMYQLRKELIKLKKTPEHVIFMAHKTEHVDIYFKYGFYVIKSSPHSFLYEHFLLKTGEIDKLIAVFS